VVDCIRLDLELWFDSAVSSALYRVGRSACTSSGAAAKQRRRSGGEAAEQRRATETARERIISRDTEDNAARMDRLAPTV
jgi:hypothetical protein